jgi:hypothetical protein
MWYSTNENQICYDRPIFAKSKKADDNDDLILVPQIDSTKKETSSAYRIIGYNWFNITTGKYISCCFFESASDAVASYKSMGYEIYNGELNIIRTD